MNFFKATKEYNTIKNHVNAPIFKCVFNTKNTEESIIEISSTGFYRLYINGKDITKGFLAPYISNPEDFVYYDLYEVTEELKKGDVQ